MSVTLHNEARSLAHLDLWRVAVVDDVNRLAQGKLDELMAWLESCGVPARQCVPRLVITQSAVDYRYRVHVSVQARNDEGRTYIDHAADRVHTEPLVIAVDSFPTWLPAHRFEE